MKKLYAGMGILGILILFIGIFIFNTESTKIFSGLCYGIGSALLALGIGNLIINFTKSQEEIQNIKRTKDIIVNDERNMLIKQKTGYMVSKIMFYIICTLVIILASINFNKIVLFLFIGILFIQFLLYIILTNYYSKKM